MAACSSGSSDTGGPDTGASSSSSSSSGSSSSSSSSSSGAADTGPDSALPGTVLYAFDDADAGVGCWAPQPYGTPGGPGYPMAEAGDGGDAGTAITIGDAGAQLLPVNGYYYLASFSTLSFDPSVGNPSPGSLEVQVPFNGYNQQGLFDCNFTTPADWTGKILYAFVKVDSGFNTSAMAPGGFVLAVKSGASFVYAQNTYTNLAANGQWQEFDFDLSNPMMMNAGFDPSQIVAVELHFDTGGGSAGAPAPAPAVFHVDSIGIK